MRAVTELCRELGSEAALLLKTCKRVAFHQVIPQGFYYWPPRLHILAFQQDRISMNPLSISDGAVFGPVRIWLRAEGFAVVALSVLLYRISGWSWWIFLALLLTPDLSMLPLSDQSESWRRFLQHRPQLFFAAGFGNRRRCPW